MAWLEFNWFPDANRDARLLKWFGFLPRSGYEFRIEGQGHLHRLGCRGRQTLYLLHELIFPPPKGWKTYRWLLSHREAIREIARLKSVFILAHLATVEENPELRRVLVWLIGRCKHTMSADMVSRLRDDPDTKVRGEVIRAAARLDAWCLLENLSIAQPNADLCDRARKALSRRPSYGERLANFATNVERTEVERQETPLMIADSVELEPHRPKARWLIRLILERIRRMLHDRHPA